jgi:OOP family OmpA-OmpF porin
MSVPALAQPADSGWYAGGAIGRSAATIDNDRISSGLAQRGTGHQLDHQRGPRHRLQAVYGGYQINRNFGVEGGYYFDLGNYGYTATTVACGHAFNGDIKLRGA